MVEKALLDTCILIDYLNGKPEARSLIADCPDHAISVITWMEVMTGVPDNTDHPDAAGVTKNFLESFTCIGIDENTRELAVMLRRSLKIKLPDAIILATARTFGRLLVTRDNDLKLEGVYVPYQL